MDTTRLSTKGQIILPKNIRTARAWGPGTEFTIEVDSSGATQVTVFEGAVEVTSLADPARSILLSRVGEATVETLTKTGQLRKVDVVKEPDNTASFAIYER